MEHSTLKKSTKILALFRFSCPSGRPLVDGRDYQQEPDLPRPRAGGARYGRADTTGRAAETRVGLSLPGRPWVSAGRGLCHSTWGFSLAGAAALMRAFNPLLQLLRPISPHRVDPPGYPVVRSRRHLPHLFDLSLVLLPHSGADSSRRSHHRAAVYPSCSKTLESLISSSFAWSSFPLPCPRSSRATHWPRGGVACGGGGRDDRHQLWPGLSYYRLRTLGTGTTWCWPGMVIIGVIGFLLDSCMQRLQQLRMVQWCYGR